MLIQDPPKSNQGSQWFQGVWTRLLKRIKFCNFFLYILNIKIQFCNVSAEQNKAKDTQAFLEFVLAYTKWTSTHCSFEMLINQRVLTPQCMALFIISRQKNCQGGHGMLSKRHPKWYMTDHMFRVWKTFRVLLYMELGGLHIWNPIPQFNLYGWTLLPALIFTVRHLGFVHMYFISSWRNIFF